MTISAIGRLISYVIVCVVLAGFTAFLVRATPAEARCLTAKCTSSKVTAEKTSSSTKTAQAAQSSHRKHGHRIASRRQQDIAKKTVIASAEGKNLPAAVADARAEMLPPDSKPSKAASTKSADGTFLESHATDGATLIEVVNPGELNELDRAAASTTVIPASFTNARAEMRDDQHSPWAQTSLIGKAFIVFGVMLTLASAARMVVA